MQSDVQQEKQWIQESQKNPGAFEFLFNRYCNLIFNYILRRTCNINASKDITANTFLKALEHIRQFTWKGIPFSVWLYRIATNEIHQHYRKSRRIVRLKDQQLVNVRSSTSSDSELLKQEETAEKYQQSRKIHQAVLSLKPKYQSVITLRYFEGLSIKEIAVILKLSENTVKTHIRRALQQLKMIL